MALLRKLIRSLFIGSLAGLGIALFTRFFFQDLIDRLEYVTYYMRYRWEYAELSNDQLNDIKKNEYGIHVIDIDDRSMQKMGLYQNWNRSYHAKMIETLNRHFPAAVIFDILFYQPEDEHHKKRLENILTRSIQIDPDITLTDKSLQSIISTIDYDSAFVAATRNAGNVFHGICLSDEKDYKDFALSQIKYRMTMEWHDSLNPLSAVSFSPEKQIEIFDEKTIIDGIFPQLAQAAQGIGHVDIIPSEDGVIREVPLFYRFGKFDPIYLPVSLRATATLFKTPDEEILFEPGKFVDVGKPFKAFMDSIGQLSFSYPNMTAAQIRLLINKSESILNLKNSQKVNISSFCAVSRDMKGSVSLEMNVPGVIPCQLSEILFSSDLKKILMLPVGEQIQIANDISFIRDSETDWVLRAPFDVEEWWFTQLDLATLSETHPDDLFFVKNGERKLLFHNLTVSNYKGRLVSTIPVLREETLEQLCSIPWNTLTSLQPGTRMDFGRNIKIPLTPYNRHIITFFGPRSIPFPVYSYYDIMNDRIQGNLDGKIFIVGSTAPALFDIKPVPHDRSYPAVEIHASLINSFITNTFIVRLNAWQNFFILLLVGITIGLASFLFKPLTGAILSIVMVFAYFLIAMTLFGSDHIWIEIARPVFTILLTYTTVMAYRYITEEKDRKFLQNTFKQYLSPELIDIMYNKKQLPVLGGEEGIRTAFFTDIQSFSTFSEKLGSPTRLVELLNEYLSEMTDILLKHFGTLDKYEGDAIIAFFGAPMPSEDHAYQACLTALDMQNALGNLRKKWVAEGDKWPDIVHQMRMRIGINTGLITTGNMGSSIRKNYTMMGDAVNLAARLESAAKQYGIYTMISNATHELVKEQFETRKIDKITVVGKSEPVIVYELIAQKGTLDPNAIRMLDLFNEGLKLFYAQEWDRAIEILLDAHLLEPLREIAPKGMTPSKKIVQYCEMYKSNPPGPDWDGVICLTSK
ncbi:MAG: adenylate/guanylate cyclase domain-containing protein [Chitinispirillaceae bacterium]|nr:adenylate/guanylate cyclase domain-containing protein [Chitinispirillaceae bacterium]